MLMSVHSEPPDHHLSTEHGDQCPWCEDPASNPRCQLAWVTSVHPQGFNFHPRVHTSCIQMSSTVFAHVVDCLLDTFSAFSTGPSNAKVELTLFYLTSSHSPSGNETESRGPSYPLPVLPQSRWCHFRDIFSWKQTWFLHLVFQSLDQCLR